MVVVMGMGFVSSYDGFNSSRRSRKNLAVGCQRPSVRSYWKVPSFNTGTFQ